MGGSGFQFDFSAPKSELVNDFRDSPIWILKRWNPENCFRLFTPPSFHGWNHGRKPVDFAGIAARFRLYAEACRQRADMYPEMAKEMLARAARWEEDAEQVERDGPHVRESRDLRRRLNKLGARIGPP